MGNTKEKEITMKDGRLHCHSENSVKDALPSVDAMCKRVSEMGARALAITDHGTVAGWWSFAKAAKKYGLKAIYGVEAYIEKHHLIMLAKDNIGLKTISLMVTESNKHLDVSGKNVYPRMSKEMIRQFIGEGTEGHEHVILTSACIGGVLAGYALDRDKANDELTKLNDKIHHAEEAQKLFDCASAEYDKYSNLLDQAKASTNFAALNKREKAIKARDDSAEKKEALLSLQKERDEMNQILAIMPDLTSSKKKAKHQMTLYRKNLVEKEKLDKWYAEKEKWDAVSLSNADLELLMKKEALEYDEIAGHGNFFIELQYHNDPREKLWMNYLDCLAHELNIPVIAANDEHMINKDDYIARKYLNSMRYITFNWDAPNDSDPELYFKTDAELKNALKGCIGNQAHIDEAMNNIGMVIDMCNAEFVAEQAYPKFESSWTKEQADAELEKTARNGIAVRYPNWNDDLEKRLQYELNIIESMGYTDYFLIVQWYVNRGRELGHMPPARYKYLKAHISEMTLDECLEYIQADQSEPGLAVGPGRGSGAGSIVCYLTGITSIDPIANGLVFERFLNPERVSMPDIDEDFANFIRDTLIEIVRKKFGHDGVACIMTRGTLAAKASIQMVAKVHGSRKKGDSKYFQDLARSMSDLIPKDPGADIAGSEKIIREQFGDDKDAMEILEIAKRLEGTYSQTGMHAAGVVIVDNADIKQYTPLMWDPKNKLWKTQMDKEEVEKNKMLKMDFLGLVNLDIITDCLRRIKKHHPYIDPKELDVENYTFDPEVISSIYASADTDSVFQFESVGMKKMLQRFKPEKFDDLVLLNAAYRPGPMQYLDDVVKVKQGVTAPHYLCSQLESILGDTYGSIIYQEQVMEIFKQLAGYSLGGADLVRRAMGHKEVDLLIKERDAFVNGDASRNIKGCVANGVSAEAASQLFDQMMEFAKYAFNKSHAAAYSKVSYITAYLKYKYPAEYFCTIMSYEAMEKMPALISGCRKRGLIVHTPDINKSEIDMSDDDKVIYFGINNVKGVSTAAGNIIAERNTHGRYTSVENFLIRTNCKKNVFVALVEAGAFDELVSDRMSLIDNAEALCEAAKAAMACNEIISLKTKMLDALEMGDKEAAANLNNGKVPNRKVLIRTMEEQKRKRRESEVVLSRYNTPGNKRENTMRKLGLEKEVLGMYVSGTPLDGYQKTAVVLKRGEPAKNINTFRPNQKVKLLVFPEEIIRRNKKSDHTPFLTMELETPISKLEAMCFGEDAMNAISSQYQSKPFVAIGQLRENKHDPETVTFFISEVEDAKLEFIPLTVSVNNVGIWRDFCIEENKKGVKSENRRYQVIAWTDNFLGEVHRSYFTCGDEVLRTMKALGKLNFHFA